MAVIPTTESATAAAIYAEYVKQRGSNWKRPHLGASQIGHHCERALWYGFRWCSAPAFPGRMLRLFETGSLEEPRAVHDLRAIGCTVHDVDPDTGRQFNYRDHGGHFAGSLDGAVLGVPEAPKTWHLLEIKTHNDKSFTKLRLEGVQRSKPMHHAQMVMYMQWAGLKRALYFAVCKNDDSIHTERLHEDPAFAERLRERALRVITAKEPPARLSLNCDWCDHKPLCFCAPCSGDDNRDESSLPPVHCRTCRSAAPVMNGGKGLWLCQRDGSERNMLLQERGCDAHLYIPALVGFARPVEEHDEYVVYQRGDTFFANTIPVAFPAIEGECYLSKGMGAAR